MTIDTNIPEYNSGFLRFCLDPSANSFVDGARSVIFAQKLDTGTQAANTLSQIVSYEDALDKAGAGSIAADMCRIFIDMYPTGQLYLVPLDDNGGATAAKYEMTVTGAPTAAGTVSFQIAEKDYQIGVALTDTADDIATNIAADLTADLTFPYTAVAAANVVTLTARNAGTVGNFLKVTYNPYLGNEFPAGVTVTDAQTAAGATDPDVAGAIAALGACEYDLIALSYHNEAEINKITDYLDTLGWSCGNSSIFGHLVHPYSADTVSDLVAYATALNKETRSAVPRLNGYHIPPHRFAASAIGRIANATDNDVSRPIVRDNGLLTGLTDSFVCGGLFNQSEKEAMADAGLLVWDVTPSGTLAIEECRTLWKKDVTGTPSRTWRFLETRFQIVFLIRLMQNIMNSEYSSHGLVDNGTRVRSGRRVVSPKILKARFIRFLEDWEGIIIDGNGNLDAMVDVQRDTDENPNGDPDRVNFLIAPDLVNQLRRAAFLVKPVLQAR